MHVSLSAFFLIYSPLNFWMGTGCSGLIKKKSNSDGGTCTAKWVIFSSVLWHLLGSLLCNYPYAVYRLGYHNVRIRASPFLQTVKGLLLLNYFTLYTISISPYLTPRLCRSVFLVPPPDEPVSINDIFGIKWRYYGPKRDILDHWGKLIFFNYTIISYQRIKVYRVDIMDM